MCCSSELQGLAIVQEEPLPLPFLEEPPPPPFPPPSGAMIVVAELEL